MPQVIQEAGAAASQMKAVLTAPRGSKQQIMALGSMADSAFHGFLGALQAVRKESG